MDTTMGQPPIQTSSLDLLSKISFNSLLDMFLHYHLGTAMPPLILLTPPVRSSSFYLFYVLFPPSPHFTKQGLFNWILNRTQVSVISNGVTNGGEAVCHHLLFCKYYLKRFPANYWFHFQGIL